MLDSRRLRRLTAPSASRHALRRQLQVTRLSAVQRYGRERAEKLGIGPEDTEVLADDGHNESFSPAIGRALRNTE